MDNHWMDNRRVYVGICSERYSNLLQQEEKKEMGLMAEKVKVGDRVLVYPGFVGQVKRVFDERLDVQVGNEILPYQRDTVKMVLERKVKDEDG